MWQAVRFLQQASYCRQKPNLAHDILLASTLDWLYNDANLTTKTHEKTPAQA